MCKLVILDTEALQANQYNVNNLRFNTLKEYSDANKIKICMTKIVDNENICRLERKCNAVNSIIKKHKQDLYILNSIDEFRNALSKKMLEEYKKTKMAEYRDFVTRYVEIIDNVPIDIDQIMNSYFNERPPFDKAEKKHEFPDAISLATAKKWIGDRSAIIVSNDNDISSLVATLNYQDSFNVFQTIDELINLLKSEEDGYQEILAFISQQNLEDTILKDQYNFEVSVYGGYDPELNNSEVIGVETVGEPNLIQSEIDYLYYSVPIVVEMKLEISCDDPDSWVYDSEEKVALYFGTEEYVRIEKFSVLVNIEMNKEDDEWMIEYLGPNNIIEYSFDPYDEECT